MLKFHLTLGLMGNILRWKARKKEIGVVTKHIQKIRKSTIMTLGRVFLCMSCLQICLAVFGTGIRAYGKEAVRRQTERLEKEALLKTMESLENAFIQNPQDPQADRILLNLGRFKKKFEDVMRADRSAVEYAKSHPEEYQHNEVGGNYIYNGRHFTRLIREYPKSALVDEAAYEMTLLSEFGECEGSVDCQIKRQFNRVSGFMRLYTSSRFIVEAVKRANAAFVLNLTRDLTAPSEHYNPQAVKEILATYEENVAALAPLVRAEAYETIADLWVRFLEYDRAKSLYRYILQEAPQYAHCSQVEDKLSEIPKVKFLLAPAEVIHYSRVRLTWNIPTIEKLSGFRVYRTIGSFGDHEGQIISGVLPADQTRYVDSTVKSAHAYEYRVEAMTRTDCILSNSITCKTPASVVQPRTMIFNQEDRCLYIFGYIKLDMPNSAGIPEIIRISEDGRLQERISGAIFGIERYAKEDHGHDDVGPSIWYVDSPNQTFLRFDRSDTGVQEQIMSSIHRSSGEIDLMLKSGKIPYYGILASIAPRSRRMWLAPRAGVYALNWDSENGLCWIGREAGVNLLDNNGNILAKLDFRVPRGIEFVTTIFADSKNASAWAYLSRKGSLVHIDRYGVILKELPICEYTGSGYDPIVVDFVRSHCWYLILRSFPSFLIKKKLDGVELLSLSSDELLGPKKRFDWNLRMAHDPATDTLWLLNGARILKISHTGKILDTIIIE